MFANFITETCTGTGTTITLLGNTVNHLTFDAAYSDGDEVAYVIEDEDGIKKCGGIGVYNAGGTLTRADSWVWDGAVYDTTPNAVMALTGGIHIVRVAADAAQLNAWNVLYQGSGTDSFQAGSASGANGTNSTAVGFRNVVDGTNSSILGGARNTVSSDNSFIGNGTYNQVEAEGGAIVSGISPDGGTTFNRVVGKYGFIGGGVNNIVGDLVNIDSPLLGRYGAIVGGNDNVISADYGFIGGGLTNNVSGGNATIAGGDGNVASGGLASITGGAGNTATSLLTTVVGGVGNSATAFGATVVGGENNAASGGSSTVLGGSGNLAASSFTVAAGRRAKAELQGQTAISDSSSFDWSNTVDTTRTWLANQMNLRHVGGYYFASAINGSGVPTAGVQVASGANAWATLSDRDRKTNFIVLEHQITINKLRNIDVSGWQYKSDVTTTKQNYYGWMAQDFHKAFNFGGNLLAIDTQQNIGVLASAVKGLISITDNQTKLIEKQQKQIETLLKAVEVK